MHFFPDWTYRDGQWESQGPGTLIRWQEGPLSEGVNGATPDLIVRALNHRMESWQSSTPSEHNAAIIRSLNSILATLDERTRDRYRRGVMGTKDP